LARVFVTRQLPGPALDQLRAQHEVDVWPGPGPPSHEQLKARSADADALIALPSDRIDAELIGASPRLLAIANYAVGYDNIDLSAAAERGIAVGNTPDVLTGATADLTIALLLAAARKLPEAMRAARDGGWTAWEPAGYLGIDVSGTTLGIIGMGRIGRRVAQRARGFEMEIRSITSSATEPELHELLENSDFVSLHAPLSVRTRHLIGADTLTWMKPSAILINTARGGLVDQAALVDALEAGVIAGAALDVTDPEPPPPGDPILTAPNLVLTPHIGSATVYARERMASLAVDNVLAVLDGMAMPNPVAAP
jgi:glyoxylate reductase